MAIWSEDWLIQINVINDQPRWPLISSSRLGMAWRSLSGSRKPIGSRGELLGHATFDAIEHAHGRQARCRARSRRPTLGYGGDELVVLGLDADASQADRFAFIVKEFVPIGAVGSFFTDIAVEAAERPNGPRLLKESASVPSAPPFRRDCRAIVMSIEIPSVGCTGPCWPQASSSGSSSSQVTKSTEWHA